MLMYHLLKGLQLTVITAHFKTVVCLQIMLLDPHERSSATFIWIMNAEVKVMHEM